MLKAGALEPLWTAAPQHGGKIRGEQSEDDEGNLNQLPCWSGDLDLLTTNLLAAAEGHPSAVMDMSFANQALSAEYMVKNHSTLQKQVYSVPENLDKQVAKLKLEAMKVSIDRLTMEQEHYLASWSEGT